MVYGATPIFQKTSYIFVQRTHCEGRENSTRRKKKTSTTKPQTSWDTARKPQCHTCNVDTDEHDHTCTQRHTQTHNSDVQKVKFRHHSTWFFIPALCDAPDMFDTHDCITHLDHAFTLFLPRGFTSCEIPSSSSYLYWKYHRRRGSTWYLSQHLKCV